MKRTIFVFFCSMITLFSCSGLKNVTSVVDNEELPIDIREIKREIKNVKDIAYYPIEESRDIFNGLFDDIKDDNYDEWGDDFTVTYETSDDLFTPDEAYIVENETITVYFYRYGEVLLSRKIREKMTAQGKRLTGFLALRADIKKNTDEYYLGNYIGKDISEVLNDFDNQYRKVSDSLLYGTGITLFWFDLRDTETNASIMRVTFYTLNNIITKIRYDYSFHR